MKRSALWILAVYLTTPLVHAEAPATSASSKPAKEKDTIAVKRGTIDPSIDADGYFEAIEPLEVRIRPKAYQGELTILSVAPHGATVKAGGTILQIDPKELNFQLAAAENELVNAKAAAEKAQADVTLGDQADSLAMTMAKDELDRAEKSVKWFEDVDGKQMLKQAQLSVTQSKYAVEDQEDELNELRKMYKSEELTSATADIVVKRAIRQLEMTRAQAGMVQDREKKIKEFDFEGAKQRVLFALDQERQQTAQLQATQAQAKVLRQTALTAANAALGKAQQKVSELKQDQAAFNVKAPADGIALYGQLAQGNWQNGGPNALHVADKVQPQQMLMTFFVPGKLKFVAQLPEAKAATVKSSAPARLVPTAFPDATTTGQCGVMVPARQPGLPFPLPIIPDRVDQRLSVGDKGSAHIAVDPVSDVLLVPIEAVQNGRVRTLGTEGKDGWKDVITGVSDGQQIEIKSGLKEGDEIYPKATK